MLQGEEHVFRFRGVHRETIGGKLGSDNIKIGLERRESQPSPFLREREGGRVWGQTKLFRGRLECNYVILVWNLSCDRKLMTVT